MVDEWGTWWDEEPGTVRGHLYTCIKQKNNLLHQPTEHTLFIFL